MYALLDWDSTLRKSATLFSWMTFMHKKGFLPAGALEEHDEIVSNYRAGKLTHDELSEEINAHYLRVIKGMKLEAYQKYLQEFLRSDIGPRIPTTVVITDWLKRNAIDIIVVSGSPLRIIRNHFDWMGVKRAFALEEGVTDGCFNGQKLSDGGSDKSKIVQACLATYHEEPILAMGDSMSDYPLIQAAKLSIMVGNECGFPDRMHGIAARIEQSDKGTRKLKRILCDFEETWGKL